MEILLSSDNPSKVTRVVSLLQERPLLVSVACGDCVEGNCEEDNSRNSYSTGGGGALMPLFCTGKHKALGEVTRLRESQYIWDFSGMPVLRRTQ